MAAFLRDASILLLGIIAAFLFDAPILLSIHLHVGIMAAFLFDAPISPSIHPLVSIAPGFFVTLLFSLSFCLSSLSFTTKYLTPWNRILL
jgi:hypothetical protein